MGLRQPAPGRVAGSGFHRGESAVYWRKRMRDALWVMAMSKTLRDTWPDVPESADFVMYWWHHAACLVRAGARGALASSPPTACGRPSTVVWCRLRWTGRRRRARGRRVPAASCCPNAQKSAPGSATGPELQPLALVYAIPDHPWVDSAQWRGRAHCDDGGRGRRARRATAHGAGRTRRWRR